MLGYDRPMTIREHYELAFKRTKYGTVAAGIVVVVALEWRYPNVSKQQFLAIGLVMGVVFGVVLTLLGHFLYRCPRCHADFRKLRIKQMGRWNRDGRFYWQIWDACPQCLVSFDEPWDGANH